MSPLDTVRRIAADVLQVDLASLTAESSPQSVETWDSVQHLNLVLALEEQFGFQFDPDEMDGMKSIGAIAALVARRNGGGIRP
jgi:acyl carrier protein